LEKDDADIKKYLEEIGSYDEFIKDPFEVVKIYYPLIVFEGKIYECVFLDEDIILNERRYMPLFVDYQSGRYKGEFHIDIVTKERFSKYLRDIMKDLVVFNQKRNNISKEYEQVVLEALRKYFKKGVVII
jgi:hypothetical protein